MSDHYQEVLEEEELEDEYTESEETESEEDAEEDQTEDNENFFGVWNRDTVSLKRLKVLLYGVAGTGKTTMAATFPAPLILDLEGGLYSTLRVGEVYRYPADPRRDIKKYSEVVDFYNKILAAKNPPFQTIVIDSLNELQRLVTQNVVARFTRVKRQYDDQLTLADYGKANNDFSKIIRLFLKLPYHIVFTAGATVREPGDEDTQITPKFVGKQVGPDVQRMMDMIGYCHAKTINNVNHHYVSFHISPKYLAKDRLGIVNRDIPNNFDSLVGSVKEQYVFEPKGEE